MPDPHLKMAELHLPGPMPAEAEAVAKIATNLVIKDVVEGKVSYLILLAFKSDNVRLWQLHDPPAPDDIVRAIIQRDQPDAIAFVYPMHLPPEVEGEWGYNVAVEAPSGKFDSLIALWGAAASAPAIPVGASVTLTVDVSDSDGDLTSLQIERTDLAGASSGTLSLAAAGLGATGGKATATLGTEMHPAGPLTLVVRALDAKGHDVAAPPVVIQLQGVGTGGTPPTVKALAFADATVQRPAQPGALRRPALVFPLRVRFGEPVGLRGGRGAVGHGCRRSGGRLDMGWGKVAFYGHLTSGMPRA